MPEPLISRQSTGKVSPRRNAFTLVELLVVISIIAMLVSIMLPVLASARKSAQQTQCLSGVRQIALALNTYAIDGKGAYPTLMGTDAIRTWGSYSTAIAADNPQGHGLLWKMGYIPSWTALYCPSRDRNTWPAQNLFNNGSAYKFGDYPKASCYNLRGWALESDGGKGISEWRVPNQPRYAIVSDLVFAWGTAESAHIQGLNVGYADASAKFVRFDTPWPGTGYTFLTRLKAWKAMPFDTIGPVNYLRVFSQVYDKL